MVSGRMAKLMDRVYSSTRKETSMMVSGITINTMEEEQSNGIGAELDTKVISLMAQRLVKENSHMKETCTKETSLMDNSMVKEGMTSQTLKKYTLVNSLITT